MKFKAAVLEESHKPLVVQEIEWSKPLEYGQVLVQLQYATICGAQLNEIDAIKGPDKFLPHVLGHEGVGIVQQIGPGVTRIVDQQLVVLHWRPAAGVQSPASHYWGNNGNRLIKAGWVTTFQEFAAVSQNRCTPIPKSEHTSEHKREMCLFGCAVTTAFGVVCNGAHHVKIGDSVLVIGVGGVGVCIAQFARLAGAAKITVIDVNQEKLDWAAKYYPAQDQILLGSNANGPEPEILAKILADRHRRFDVVFETTGSKQMREFAFEVLTEDGHCELVGVPKPSEKMALNSLDLHFGKSISGSKGGESQPDRDIPRLFNMMLDDRFTLKGMIEKTVSLDNINEGIDYMRSGGVGRVLVDLRSA
jgi:S-(hydroxymethyl)glutathione dehydrogenase / alcohol dehydrogenase